MEMSKVVEIVSRKLQVSNIERCLNCERFSECEERKEEIVVCDRFKELDIKKQLIVVGLEEYSKLKGLRKQPTLCSF